jgi:hypothetical protein
MTKVRGRSSTTTFQSLCEEAEGHNRRAFNLLKEAKPDQALIELFEAQSCRLEAKRYVEAQRDTGKALGKLHRLGDVTDHYYEMAHLVIDRRERGPRPGFWGRIIDFIDRPGFPIPDKESA